MGRDLLAFFNDLVGGDAQGRAADGHRTRCISAAPDGDRVGITLHQAHGFKLDAQKFAHHLRIGGFVPLPVGKRAGDHRDSARGIKPNFHAVVEKRRRFQIAGNTAPTQEAVLFTVLAAFFEAVPIGRLQNLIHNHIKLAAVIGVHQRRLVGHLIGLNEVNSAQLGRVLTHFCGRNIDQTLQDIRGFGPPGAPVGRGADGVGEDGIGLPPNRRDRVDAGQ